MTGGSSSPNVCHDRLLDLDDSLFVELFVRRPRYPDRLVVLLRRRTPTIRVTRTSHPGNDFSSGAKAQSLLPTGVAHSSLAHPLERLPNPARRGDGACMAWFAGD